MMDRSALLAIIMCSLVLFSLIVYSQSTEDPEYIAVLQTAIVDAEQRIRAGTMTRAEFHGLDANVVRRLPPDALHDILIKIDQAGVDLALPYRHPNIEAALDTIYQFPISNWFSDSTHVILGPERTILVGGLPDNFYVRSIGPLSNTLENIAIFDGNNIVSLTHLETRGHLDDGTPIPVIRIDFGRFPQGHRNERLLLGPHDLRGFVTKYPSTN